MNAILREILHIGIQIPRPLVDNKHLEPKLVGIYVRGVEKI